MGGIYTLGTQPGTVIRNNRFHDIAAIKYGGWGIYFDEGTSNVVAENNVVYRTTHGGLHQHYGRDNVFRNNIIAFGRDAQVQRTRLESHQSFTFERNIVYWDKGELTVGDWSNRNVTFDHNVYWKPDGSKDLRIGNLPLDQWRTQGMDPHSVLADPKFVDAARGNFNLQSDSPALVAGFVPFDQSDVGPRGK
jgi:parallel beta-helix repeat protein